MTQGQFDLESSSKSPGNELVQEPNVINTWFKYGGKISSDLSYRFHRESQRRKLKTEMKDRTKNIMFSPVVGGGEIYGNLLPVPTQ